MNISSIYSLVFLLTFFLNYVSYSQERIRSIFTPAVSDDLSEMMREGGIPGMSIVVFKNGLTIKKSFGYSDVKANKLVTSNTLFELGSCSKAFTALSVLNLVTEKKIDLDDYVTKYLPWFKVYYKEQVVEVKIRQLLNHTSGISWQTIFEIPQSTSSDALTKTVKKFSGQRLKHKPGETYEYATVNYDILALIVQTVTHQPFEFYTTRHILSKLQLTNTSIGIPSQQHLMSKGYKIGFFYPRYYDAPRYKGNNAAGYYISNADDMAKWLRAQLEDNSPLSQLIKQSHIGDRTVPLHNLSSYASGWEVSDSKNEIFHSGLNPNYSSFIIMRPQQNSGVVVLTNSNSSLTPAIGYKIMQLISNEPVDAVTDKQNQEDKLFSIASIIIGIYIILIISFICSIIVDINYKRRLYKAFNLRSAGICVLIALCILPFVYGVYLLPQVILNSGWEAATVWAPISFPVAAVLILSAIALTYIFILLNLCFPHKQSFRNIAPGIILISILSGIANMVLILLITSSLKESVPSRYVVFYFVLTLLVYVFGRRFVQISLIKFSRGVVFELRMKIMEKIFSTSFQKFEKIDRGKVYTALNDDVGTIGDSSNMFIMLITSLFTALAAFTYLASIAFWSTVLTIVFVGVLAATYSIISGKTNIYFQQARDSRNVFMRLTNTMIDGFKELSLSRSKKLEYNKEIEQVADDFRQKSIKANIGFVNASIVGESVLIFLLAVVTFAFPRIFPAIKQEVIMSYIIILLYLMGPVNAILNAIPGVLQFRIAWKRIKQFLNEIPANLSLNDKVDYVPAVVEQFEAINLTFQYEDEKNKSSFNVGPLNLDIAKGEIVFIIGGNGSGKTTLAKLLTGLYKPLEGSIVINGKPVLSSQLGEHFSTVFSPSYLFEKIYSINVDGHQEDVKKYLKTLDLEGKVSLVGNTYSTINLSGGQRKRLALMQCYLENSPIYLFDEWAADQDPSYRHFFYRTLLPEMRKNNKIVIAITHDDHYFDVADKVYKMDQGKLYEYTTKTLIAS